MSKIIRNWPFPGGFIHLYMQQKTRPVAFAVYEKNVHTGFRYAKGFKNVKQR